ncbi:hypothetical protein M0R04_10270 [Candidatus Dojkabacteria bacterium]|jgi:hypothetical protein|nr:hypothetical protein [Candidatus Dojkabacteria bacterium]
MKIIKSNQYVPLEIVFFIRKNTKLVRNYLEESTPKYKFSTRNINLTIDYATSSLTCEEVAKKYNVCIQTVNRIYETYAGKVIMLYARNF